MSGVKLAKSTQEQAVAAWIGFRKRNKQGFRLHLFDLDFRL